MSEVTLKQAELAVLKVLYRTTDAFGENCIYFRTIASDAEMSISEVSKAARSLKAMGLVQFKRGLMRDDGMMAGSGYAITSDGVSAIAPFTEVSDA